MAEFAKGDRVSWRSHGVKVVGTVVGTVVGKVKSRLTSPTRAAGRTAKASADEPQYLVEGEKGGRAAVHKPGALTKIAPKKT